MNRARILITGASGFLGQSLARTFGRDELIALSRRTGSAPGFSRTIACDLTAPIPPSVLPERIDVLLHLAQPRRDDPAGASWKVNVDATRVLLTHAARNSSMFVFASTGNVYRPKLGIHAEDDALDLETSDPYVRSKIAAEKLVSEAGGLVVRLFTPYGPGQRRRMIPDLILRILRGETVTLYSGGRPAVSPIHVDDLGVQLVAAVRAHVAGTFNVAGTEYSDVRELSLKIARLAGRDVAFAAREAVTAFDLIGDAHRWEAATGIAPRISLNHGLAELIQELVGAPDIVAT